jgi:protein phosphatase 2C family protein 2/3
VFDGHGGSSCADFLRDNLHHYIIKDSNFPNNPIESIKNGFKNAENEFLNNYAMSETGDVIDRSGTCAVVSLLIDEMCYVANVGDSRAILSTELGKSFKVLTIDHKPNEENETKRIIENNGKVYQ